MTIQNVKIEQKRDFNTKIFHFDFYIFNFYELLSYEIIDGQADKNYRQHDRGPVDLFLQAALGGVKAARLAESRTESRAPLLQED